MPHSARRLALRRLMIPLIGVLLAVSIVAGFELFTARAHLQRGASDMQAATVRLTTQKLLTDPWERRRLRASLVRSQQQFASARHDLWLWGPLLPHLSWIPHFGVQLASAPAAADTGFYATRGVVRLLDGLAPLRTLFLPSHAGTTSLAQLTQHIAAGHAQFVGATSDLSAAQLALHKLPNNLGNAGLNAARDRYAGVLPTAANSARLLSLTPGLL